MADGAASEGRGGEGEAPRPLVLPPLRRTARDAEAFARIVHEGRQDKDGLPYWRHLKRVAIRADDKLPHGTDEWIVDVVAQIAWLHDVLEDTPYTAADLAREGFSPVVVEGLVALAKLEGRRPYLEWIGQLCATASLPAILVKISDIEDDSSPGRLALLDSGMRARFAAKYPPARELLLEAAARHGWEDRSRPPPGPGAPRP